MDFKTAIEHYQNGTATDQERLLVEEELDKFLLLEALTKEDAPAEEPPEAEKSDDFQNIRRRLRKRSALQTITSVLLTLALLLGILRLGIPAAESLYWSPEDSSFGTEASDLTILVDTYANLFCPEISVTSVSGSRTGFASYSLELRYIPATEYPDFAYGHGTLEKGVLSIPESFWPTVPKNRLHSYPLDKYNWAHTVDRLTQLPEYIRVGAFVSFAEDISMQELLGFRWSLVEDNKDHPLTQTAWYWTAIRCYEDTEENYRLPHCGLGSGGYVYTREMNLHYPGFDGTLYPGDTSQGIGVASSLDAKLHEDRFISQLTFMRDMCEQGRGIGDQAFYEGALRYIEENGINAYGCFIVCSPQSLLDIMEMENVSGVFIEDFWLGI